MPNLQGCVQKFNNTNNSQQHQQQKQKNKDHGHIKDQEDAQPPRVRRMKQASPPRFIFMFPPKYNPEHCARPKEPEQKKSGTGRIGLGQLEILRGGNELYCGELSETFLFYFINSFGKFGENVIDNSAVPQQSARVCWYPTYCRYSAAVSMYSQWMTDRHRRPDSIGRASNHV